MFNKLNSYLVLCIFYRVSENLATQLILLIEQLGDILIFTIILSECEACRHVEEYM